MGNVWLTNEIMVSSTGTSRSPLNIFKQSDRDGYVRPEIRTPTLEWGFESQPLTTGC